MKKSNATICLLSGLLFCFTFLNQLTAQNYLWAKNHGGGAASIVTRAMASGELSGSSYHISGGFFRYGNAQFGTTTLTQAGFDTPYLAKYDDDGDVVWASTVHDVHGQISQVKICESSDEIYITGRSNGSSTTFGSGAGAIGPVSGNFTFVAKLSSSGQVLWVVEVPYLELWSLAVNNSGDVALWGHAIGNPSQILKHTSSGTTTLTSTISGSGTSVLFKLNAAGNLQYAKKLNGYSVWTLNENNLEMDDNGNITVSLHLDETTAYNFGTCSTCSFTTPSVSYWYFVLYVARFDNNGNAVWLTQVLNNGNGGIGGLSTDAAGDVYVSIFYSGTGSPSVGSTSLPVTAANDKVHPVLIKLESDGTIAWAIPGTTSTPQPIVGVLGQESVADNCGYVYYSGYFHSTSLTFGSTTITKPVASLPGAYFIKVNSNTGDIVWATAIEHFSDNIDVTVDSDKHLVAQFQARSVSFPSSVSQTLSSANNTLDQFIFSIETGELTPEYTVLPSCPGQCLGAITATGITNALGTFTYNLNSGGYQSSGTYTGLCPGNYSLEVLSEYGCYATEDINVPTGDDPWYKHPISQSATLDEAMGLGCQATSGSGYYMCGSFMNNIEFPHYASYTGNASNNIILTNTSTPNNHDGYLARYGDCGVDWAFRVGSSAVDYEYANCVVYNHNSLLLGVNVYGPLTGGILDGNGLITTTSVNGINLTTLTPGVKKGLVIKVDPATGAIGWVYVMGDNLSEVTEVEDIKIQSDGTVYAAGNFISAYSVYSNGSLFITQGSWDPILIQLASNGSFINGVSWGSPDEDRIHAIDLDESILNNTDVYATGFVSHQQVQVPGLSPNPAGLPTDLNDLFVAKLNQLLVFQNFRAHRSVGNDDGTDIKAFPQSIEVTCLVTGYFEESLTLYTPNSNLATITVNGYGPGNKDAFVGAFDIYQFPFWLQPGVSSGTDDQGTALTLLGTTSQASVFATGMYSGTPSSTDFLSGLPTSTSTQPDIFTTQFQAINGTQLSLQSQNGDGRDASMDLSNDGTALYNVGFTNSTGGLTFPGQSDLVPTSTVDAFYGRFDPTVTFFKTNQPAVTARLSQEKSRSGMSFSPNPLRSSDELTVKFEAAFSGQILIRDMSGRIVQSDQLRQTTNRVISVDRLESGTYLIEAIDANQRSLGAQQLMVIH